MSTKVTLLLTTDNEHWYEETNSRYYEETKTESAIVLEFDEKHKVEVDSDGTRLIIESGTELYKAIRKVFAGKNG